MAKGAYLGDGTANKGKKIYIGDESDTARKVKKGYIGVDGTAKLFYSSGGLEQLSNLSTGRVGMMCASTKNYVIYAGGAISEQSFSSQVTCYNEDGTQITASPLSVARYVGQGVGHSSCNYAFFGGGMNASGAVSTLDIYDGTTRVLSDSLAVATAGLCGAMAIGTNSINTTTGVKDTSKAIFVGGSSNGLVFNLASTEIDAETLEVTKRTDWPKYPIFFGASTTFEKDALFVGGVKNSSGSFQTSNLWMDSKLGVHYTYGLTDYPGIAPGQMCGATAFDGSIDTCFVSGGLGSNSTINNICYKIDKDMVSAGSITLYNSSLPNIQIGQANNSAIINTDTTLEIIDAATSTLTRINKTTTRVSNNPGGQIGDKVIFAGEGSNHNGVFSYIPE